MHTNITQKNLWPLYVFIFSLPMGTAAQGFALGICILTLLYLIIKNDYKKNIKEFIYYLTHTPYIMVMLFWLWMIITTLINNDYPRTSSQIIEFSCGYLPFVILPPIFLVYYQTLNINQINKIFKFFAISIIILALICLSQYFIGWHREGLWIAKFQKRATGMFSHPLTLAYVACIIWPFAIYIFFINPKKILNFAFFISLIIIIATSMSRIVQPLALLFLILNIILFIKHKLKWLYLGIIILTLILLAIIPNQIYMRFKKTITNNPQRTTEKYYDDRLAFWDAHWQLIKQKPIIGHGFFIPSSLLNKAYAKIGLDNFVKKYAAHNIYIQITTEGGLIGLLFFLSWYIWFIFIPYLKFKSQNKFFASITMQSWIIFALASISQNSFQDYEVRYSLIGLSFISLMIFKNSINYLNYNTPNITP